MVQNKVLISFLFFLCSTFFLFSVQAESIKDVFEKLKTVQAGDTLVIDNGKYSNIDLKITATGTAKKPIVIKAQTAGGVVFSGYSTIRLAGEYIEISGILFTDGYASKGAVIEFRNGKDVANNCKITDCAIINYTKPDRTDENIWVSLYGKQNEFSHNTLVGKKNLGCILVVQLNDERSEQNKHRISNNYFSRPLLGSNGGECIRVGNAQYSLVSSQTIIENNYFENCDGEVEIVSIKSCDNIIRNNTFYLSQGVLALRHGNRNIVEGNAFIGGEIKNTGGIRIVNAGHKIKNNYFEFLTGRRFFAALAIMNAVPNSLPNRYHQVVDVEISGNVWNNCDNIEFGVGADLERTLAPFNVTIADNYFCNSNLRFFSSDSGYHFKNNKTLTAAVKNNPAKSAAKKSDCGARWLSADMLVATVPAVSAATAFADIANFVSALKNTNEGDTLMFIEAGEYVFKETIEIDKTIVISVREDLVGKVIFKYGGAGKNPVIRIMDNGNLRVNGVWFSGLPVGGNAPPVAAVSPNTVMSGSYSAYFTNCKFSDFYENSFSAFRAQKGTFADTLFFSDCEFFNISGDAIFLATEKDDRGTYNAENILIKNNSFHDILSSAVNIYRGGSDESTAGPSLIFSGNKINSVDNRERGAALRLTGVQNILIENSEFLNSGRGGCSIRFDEASFDIIKIRNNIFSNSGKIFSFYGNIINETTITE
jgi:poly(beta-D-mannuronate) lyase